MFGILRGPAAGVADVTASVAAAGAQLQSGGKRGAGAGVGGGGASSAAGAPSAGGASSSAGLIAPLPTQAEVSRALQLIRDHPQMTELDKCNVVSVLAQSPRFAAAVAAAPAALLPPGFKEQAGGAGGAQPEWEQYMSLKGIVASSQKPVAPEKVYKIRGVGEVEGEPEVIYHYMSNVNAVREWDPLLRRADMLQRDPHCALPVLEAGFDVMLYGVPGFSLVFSERQFLLRVMGLELPDRTRVIAVYSLPEGVAPPASVKDVGVPARAVRAHMAVTGAVITPLVMSPGQHQQQQQQQAHSQQQHHGGVGSVPSSSGGGGGAAGACSAGGGRRASGSHGHGRHHARALLSPTSHRAQQQQQQHHPFSPAAAATPTPQRCEVTLLVQVDPRGGVPPSVVHACALTMPANLQRVRASVAKASAARGGALVAEQRAARSAALASARRMYHDAARAFGASPAGGASSLSGSAASAGGAGAGAVAAALSATLCLTHAHGHGGGKGGDAGAVEPRKSALAAAAE